MANEYFVKIENDLVFIKSKYINVFPCGRRRARLIDELNDDKTSGYIPFDPEARLNTEANNRKHSGLNGFKQSYLVHWSNDTRDGILFAISSYLFKIALALDNTSNNIEPKDFGKTLASENYLNNDIDGELIYATIRLADVALFGGSAEIETVGTEVLRDQATTSFPSTCLDLLIPYETLAKTDKELTINNYKNKSTSYYFSGLSFSKKDLTDKDEKVISVPILIKNGEWQIYDLFRLPEIEHGDTRHSVNIPGDLSISATEDARGDLSVAGDLTVTGTVDARDVIVQKTVDNETVRMSAAAIKIDETEASSGIWQLKLYT